MKTAQPVTVRRLEQFLQSYDELMWAAKITSLGQKKAQAEQGYPLTGPVLHHKELRKHLLEIRSPEDFDTSRFDLPDNLYRMRPDGQFEYGVNTLFPPISGSHMIAGWVSQSRRVFHVEQDLQAMLGATSLESVDMGDIKLPFGSFGISLDRPIRHTDDPVREADFILYSNLPGIEEEGSNQRSVWIPSIMLFNTELDNWRPTTCREAADRKVSRGKLNDAWGIVDNKGVIRRNCQRLYRILSLNVREGDTVGSMIEPLQHLSYGASGATQAWRIVYGLCLYLSILSKDSPKVSPWGRVETRRQFGSSPDLSAITDEMQVCTVSSIRTLTVDERETFFQQLSKVDGHEVAAHFRIGHWRRPPRTAHNPSQPKTVWVQPTIVRRDRLPAGSVPAGAQVNLG